MSGDQFHNVATIQEEKKAKSGLTAFVGDGTPVLRVPGLKEVKKLFIGNEELPLKIKELQLVDSAGNTEPVEIDMVQLTKDAEGEILLRNKKSNDGIWQDGQKFYIEGVFDTPKTPKPAETK